MQTSNYWKQFENTGKISDYLSYREHCDYGDGKYKKAAETSHCADGRDRMTNSPDRDAGYIARMD